MPFEHYEIWALRGGTWELLGWFRDFDVANTVARGRHSTGVRLVHAVFEEGQPPRRDTLAEIGATRAEP
jgi:hypothetical protein